MPRFLVLDDEPLIAALLKDWLAELGYETLGPAHSVPVALDLLRTGRPDAAILDLSVGRTTSYSVADALMENGVPFAFASGHSGDRIAPRYGDALTLQKPFDFAGVKRVASVLLSRNADSAT